MATGALPLLPTSVAEAAGVLIRARDGAIPIGTRNIYTDPLITLKKRVGRVYAVYGFSIFLMIVMIFGDIFNDNSFSFLGVGVYILAAYFKKGAGRVYMYTMFLIIL